jgi:hypothetical protein
VRLRPSSGFLRSLMLVSWAVAGLSSAVQAQGGDPAVREAFFRVVGEHFSVPLQEVTIISGWELSPDEVPVVLFLAQRAGVSPDALIGARRGGRPWREVAARFGVDARAFHIPLPGDLDLGPLSRAYGEFQGRPSGEWSKILLEDQEVVGLVNLRVLSDQTGASPEGIIRARVEAGSFLACYPLLIRR